MKKNMLIDFFHNRIDGDGRNDYLEFNYSPSFGLIELNRELSPLYNWILENISEKGAACLVEKGEIGVIDFIYFDSLYELCLWIEKKLSLCIKDNISDLLLEIKDYKDIDKKKYLKND